MDSKKVLNNITDLTLYTGSNGKNKCTCKCAGCTQYNYGKKHEDYQGNINQIKTIIKYLPNLKNAYILGNPDPTVDTVFCNIAAKEFVKHNKNVMFSTSGFNALETIKTLTKDIPSKNITYISFSIDSLKKDTIKKLKGSNKIDLSLVEKAILYCKSNNIKVKIQPTLWQINQDEYKDIINYFYKKYGITWFTFHLGSFEALNENETDILKHIEPEKWYQIRNNIKQIAIENNLKISIPKVFLDDKEYKEYNHKNNYCYNPGKGLQIWLEKDNLRCTYCPIYTEVNNNFYFNLEDKEISLKVPNENYLECLDCVAAKRCISKELKDKSEYKIGYTFKFNQSNKNKNNDDNDINITNKFHNVCRFYSDKINY